MYIVLSMISCLGVPSKDTEAQDTHTTHTGIESLQNWTGLDLGPDGLCLVADDASYLCIGHDGAEYRYTFAQAERLSVAQDYACALNAGALACTYPLHRDTPATGGYSDVQTGSTFACASKPEHGSLTCWGANLPAYDRAFMDRAKAYSVGEFVVCGASPAPSPAARCYSPGGLVFHTFQGTGEILSVTAGHDRVCVLYQNNDGSTWGFCWKLQNTAHSIPIDINGVYDPASLRAASDDSLLCGATYDDSVYCSDLIDLPPTGRLSFPARGALVQDYDAHAGVACVLYDDGKVTCLGLENTTSKIPSRLADFAP